MKYQADNTFYHPQKTLIYTAQLARQNELKLTYSNVGIQKTSAVCKFDFIDTHMGIIQIMLD